jgi:predicted transposase YbfD/YdcC
LEERRLRASTELTGYLDFPHCQQVFRVERITRKLDGSPLRHEVVSGITSLTPEKAGPMRLLEILRGHWEIENRLHWVRDVTFDEDRSQVRTGVGARVMASLRNLAIGVLRLAGATHIAAALRHVSYNVARPLRLVGLAMG